MKILCDQMLGTLAKWLRISGFDTYYADFQITDEELLKIAKKEKRILISRDKELIIRARKEKIKYLGIKTVDLDEQLKLVMKNISLDEEKILTRCNLCNTVLYNIDKKDVKNKIPDRIYKQHNQFWYCSKCDKIYWRGTHYNKMIDKIKELTST